jgi:nitrogen fixation protein NifU and related proteins
MTDNALRELYQEVILDHSRHPRHYGTLDQASHKAEGYNPLCGDRVTVYLKLGEDGRVADIKFQGKGCAISQASASMMTDLVIGKSVDDAMSVCQEFLELMKSRGAGEPDEDLLEDAVAFAGVSKFPARIKCALLGWMAWKDATARALEEAPSS